MIEKKLQVFINSLVNYFAHTNDADVQVGSPFLTSSIHDIKADYTAMIAISGKYTGVCYFMAPKVLVKHLILSLGDDDMSDQMIEDTVGEVANTLSGNARKELGRDFIISVPKVIQGVPKDVPTDGDSRLYAIPFKWKAYSAMLGVSLVK